MAMLVSGRVQLPTTPSSTEARYDLDLLPGRTKNHRLLVQRKLLAKNGKLNTRTWQPAPAPTYIFLDGGFKYFLFSPLFGEDFQFD